MAAETSYLYLTTTGRKSGLPRQIEIWFVEHESCWYIVSGGREDADWVKNLAANPTSEVRIGTRESSPVAVHGRALGSADDKALADAVSAKMDAKYGWSDGLIVELCPF
jgi:deazaflavin-dependent oxidoreductase (nitroreductase family)